MEPPKNENAAKVNLVADLVSWRGIHGKVVMNCVDYIKRKRMPALSRTQLNLRCISKKISQNNDKGNIAS